ncbi:hypothetical protein [Embleya sp. NPDC020886]|uniref:hypothetical protein n=1 Tax=Embleya sp. NPDC020886 TaxID=3363980 RepID=UPI0037A37265
MTSGAYDELTRNGRLGDASLDLLRCVGRQVTRTQGFPPPEGYSGWTDEAVDVLLAEMFSRKGEQFVLDCFLKAVDDTSLEKMFYASIRYFLIDQAKGTERGKLRRRFAKRLAEDAKYSAVGGASPRWALASHPIGVVWQGDLDELVRVAWDVRGVWITAWNHSGPTPKKTEHALMTVLEAVLEAAGGAVREEDLARVLEARFFDQPTTPEITTLYANSGSLIDPAMNQAQGADPLDPVGAETVAGEIWTQMSPDERQLLRYLEDTTSEVAVHLGIGVHQARAIMEALREKLRRALTGEGDDMHAVVSALLRRAEAMP